jgi:dihydrofolate reductase
MRRIVASAFISLDGVMQAPGGPAEDPTGDFTLGGWTAPYFDEALGEGMGEIFGRPFDLLLGRKTYEIFAAHWPTSAIPTTPSPRYSTASPSTSPRAPTPSSTGRTASGWATIRPRR